MDVAVLLDKPGGFDRDSMTSPTVSKVTFKGGGGGGGAQPSPFYTAHANSSAEELSLATKMFPKKNSKI